MEHLWSYLCHVIDEVSRCNLPLNTKEDRVLRSKAELSVKPPFFRAAFRRAGSLKSTEIMFVGHFFIFAPTNVKIPIQTCQQDTNFHMMKEAQEKKKRKIFIKLPRQILAPKYYKYLNK